MSAAHTDEFSRPNLSEPSRHKLLRLLASSAFAAGPMLTEAEWDQLDQMARQHLLQPLLHYRIQSTDISGMVPTRLQHAWSEAFRHSSLDALTRQASLKRIVETLAGSGITAVALKGTSLAWTAYPHPGLRPMRDIDLLVRQRDAITAFELLFL